MNDSITIDLRQRLQKHKSDLGKLPKSDIEIGRVLCEQIENADTYQQFWGWAFRAVEIPGEFAVKSMRAYREQQAETDAATNPNQ